jgi:hypothetical protein
MTTLCPTIGQLSFDNAAEAIARVDAHADPQWKDIALAKIKFLCETRATFTADDLADEMDKTFAVTHDGREAGAVMRRAQSNGWCFKTTTFTKTKRKHCHSSDLPIWQSLLYPSSSF